MSVKETEYSTETCKFYLDLIQEEHDLISSFFGKIVQIVLTLPLLINAGAVIALANFFTSGDVHPQQIIYGGSAFLAGTIFGLIAIIYEFFISYKLWNHVNEWGPLLGKKTGGNLNKVMKQLIEYSNNKIKRDKRLRRIIRFGVLNSSFSVMSFMIGVYFITVYILNSYCLATVISIILVLYFICATLWLRTQLKVE